MKHEDKKKNLEKFYNTEKGKDLKLKFKRILIYSISLIIMGMYLLIEAILIKNSTAQIIYGSLLTIIGFFFSIVRIKTINRHLHEFLAKEKK